MSFLGRTQVYKFGTKSREQRKTSRRRAGATAWIGLDGRFAVRQCRMVDLSNAGVQITIEAPETVPGVFTLMMSRDNRLGRRARVKWRRGAQIGAEFF
jgi:hypothetical protein